jgi:sigma-B regulation protein RsbU (phosphoserine phosphatase)
MLELKDFYHLPQVELLIEQVVVDGPGLIVVAGLDPRPLSPSSAGEGFLPSGRSAILRILMRQILVTHRNAQATVVAEIEDAIRIPRGLRSRIHLSLVQPDETFAETMAHATLRRPDLLVIEHLTPETAPAALEAAQSGLRVLSQLDTVFRGAGVARHLLDLGVPRALLGGLAWIVAVQRLATLCPRCKEPAVPEPVLLAGLRRQYPDLDLALEGKSFYRAPGCGQCQYTGREGEITTFDIFRADTPNPLEQRSLLSLEDYLLGLAIQGYLPLDDLLHLEADQLRRTYSLMAASHRATVDTSLELQRRLAELEAANRVLQQRTEALVSLQGIGRALITSAGLDELAAQLCRQAGDLSGSDRVILYFLRPEEGMAEVLSVCGWDPSLVHQPLKAELLFGTDAGTEPQAYNRLPPGVPRDPTDVTATGLQAGLRVPLVAQEKPVGLMIVHTSQKSRFEPGEVALLQTFANQAAVAIQRAGLIEALQEKIEQLEATQAELVQKERMERELELARQVQQSVLPRIFPLVPGYAFAARNRPARQVGGDFYDVILLDAERFGLVIGDVSDKGMPAALYMALTRSLLLAEARHQSSPRAVLGSVHRLLQELGRPGLFVTVFYGVVDGPTRRLTYARAGHDHPLLLRAGQILPLGGVGTVLGFPDLDELHLSEQQLDLLPGDRLLLYTDGLTDVLSASGQHLGIDRLLTLVQSHAHLSATEFCAATFADLGAYQGNAKQYDDMTMLVIEVK